MNDGKSDAPPKKIVVIGGGTGTSTLLRGLRQHNTSLSAIVTMFDSGGSSGILRREFAYPPFGDLRQCLVALSSNSEKNQAFRGAFEFRFGSDTSLNGHNVGNLLLAALTSMMEDRLDLAIEEASRILEVEGSVIPVTLTTADLCAELMDGRIIRGESDIDIREMPNPRIRRIYIEPELEANPAAIKAIEEADAIVMGPGDLFTSVLPNLAVNGVPEAIAVSNATRIYVCNLMTKRGETDGFGASEFVAEMKNYLLDSSLDWVIVNTAVPTPALQRAYEQEGAYTVKPDIKSVSSQVAGVLATPLLTSDLPLRHASDRTAEAILRALSAGRVCGQTMRPALTGAG